MAALPFETPEFTALLDDAEIWLDAWVAQLHTATLSVFNMTTGDFYAVQAYALLIAGESLVAGYRARNASKARHNVISTGAVKAPRRETAQDSINRQSRILGTYRGAA